MSAKSDRDVSAALEVTLQEICSMYSKVNSKLPVVGERQIMKKMKSLYSEYRDQIRGRYQVIYSNFIILIIQTCQLITLQNVAYETYYPINMK